MRGNDVTMGRVTTMDGLSRTDLCDAERHGKSAFEQRTNEIRREKLIQLKTNMTNME